MIKVLLLIAYILIGLGIVLWDFRNVIRMKFSILRAIITPNPFDRVGVLGRNRQGILTDPTYVRELNYGLATIYVLLWPVKLGTQLLRTKRISSRKNKHHRLSLKDTLKEYELLVNALTVSSEDAYVEFRIPEQDNTVFTIHSGNISYNQTAEDLSCPTGTKHIVYILKKIAESVDEKIWNIEESNTPFGIRMSGYGSEYQYKETDKGELSLEKETGNWIS